MKPTVTTRRTLLASLAAATAVAASSASPEAAETPELVQLGDRIEATLAAYLTACERVRIIKAEWQPEAPALPKVTRPDGVEDGIIRFSNGSRRYTDISGKPITVPWGKDGGCTRVVDLGTAESFEAAAAAHWKEADRKSEFKSQRGMKQEIRWAESDACKVEPARRYWSAFDRIVERSGIEVALQARADAREALHALTGAIMECRESTVTGLVIKAQAYAAWGRVERFYVIVNLDAPQWSQQISETILRQAGA